MIHDQRLDLFYSFECNLEKGRKPIHVSTTQHYKNNSKLVAQASPGVLCFTLKLCECVTFRVKGSCLGAVEVAASELELVEGLKASKPAGSVELRTIASPHGFTSRIGWTGGRRWLVGLIERNFFSVEKIIKNLEVAIVLRLCPRVKGATDWTGLFCCVVGEVEDRGLICCSPSISGTGLRISLPRNLSARAYVRADFEVLKASCFGLC